MAIFALVEDGIVAQVISVKDCAIGGCLSHDDPDYMADPDAHADCGSLTYPKTEPEGQKFLQTIGLEGEWVQTSPTGKFRGAYAGIGYTWDGKKFAAPVSVQADPEP